MSTADPLPPSSALSDLHLPVPRPEWLPPLSSIKPPSLPSHIPETLLRPAWDGELVHFEPVGVSQTEKDFADLLTVDMSTFDDGPAARAALAETVRAAMHEQGFFVLTNYGISKAEVDRQLDIAWTIFQKTPLDEKIRLRGRMQETGSYKGFKLRDYYEFGNGVKDKIEQFNWDRSMAAQEFPSTMLPWFDEVKAFTRKVHEVVMFNVLRLFALALELPEETFVEKHKFDVHDEAWMRYMAYYDEHTEADLEKTKGLWLKGHQDFGTLTMLFSQPMASLQVRDDAGKWQYVRHVPGAMIINCGVMMEWYTGRYFKAANHRVTAPPPDQRGRPRLGVFYFAVPNDEERPDTLMRSGVLRRAGCVPLWAGAGAGRPEGAESGEEGAEQGEKGLSSRVYSQARIARVGKSETYMKQWGDGEVVVERIAGVDVPWYG